MNLLGVVAAVALALLPLPSRATPLTEPIVFDFEDGLQGWELLGSAQRVQTQLLGGEWAIFGDGTLRDGAAIFLPLGEADPRVFARTFDVLVIEGSGRLPTGILFDGVRVGVVLSWGSRSGTVAFIDNITFHPVPEPSILVLLALGLAALARRRVR